jgi:hypothetical protein
MPGDKIVDEVFISEDMEIVYHTKSVDRGVFKKALLRCFTF